MTDIHSASLEQARDAYKSAGLIVSTTYAHPYRRRTDAERAALEMATISDPGSAAAAAARTALAAGEWITDETQRQLRLDLERGSYVALRVPAALHAQLSPHYRPMPGADVPAVWAGLVSHVRHAPAIESHDGNVVTVLFRQIEGAPIPEHRVLELVVSEPGFERVRPVQDEGSHGGVRLPHGGCLERWAREGGPVHSANIPTLPAELAPLTIGTSTADPGLIADWLDRHYERIGMLSSAKPTTRAEVYRCWLAANSLLPEQYSEPAFGSACARATCFQSKRTKHGITWQITRRAGVPFAAMAGVAVDTISAVDLAEFRQWKHSIELSPARQRARREAAEAAAVKQRQREYVLQHFGSQEICDVLNQTGYTRYHVAAEARRQKAGDPFGREWRPLDLAKARADWWLDATGQFDATIEPQARYEALVTRLILSPGVKS